uniref:broad substrate specificity ATP-binding cassette transporter ABCG2-like n=1 Tax=Callospermophilus lateralis TaxID=76772 RepID=UPI0040389056
MSSNNDQVVIPMLRRHTNGLPEMISTDGETITQGAVLSFHNICYRGQEKRGSLLRRRTVEKEILSNISISEQGRTIIFTIHQPRYSIFKLFDSLTLLASGKLMYHGPAQEALEYFESAGYSGEEYQNPADFFLDIINGNVPPINREEENEAEETEQLFQREKPVIEALAEFYANSAFYRDTEAELERLAGGRNSRSLAFREITCVTSFFHQFRWIFWRSFKNLLGFPSVTRRQAFSKSNKSQFLCKCSWKLQS